MNRLENQARKRALGFSKNIRIFFLPAWDKKFLTRSIVANGMTWRQCYEAAHLKLDLANRVLKRLRGLND